MLESVGEISLADMPKKWKLSALREENTVIGLVPVTALGPNGESATQFFHPWSQSQQTVHAVLATTYRNHRLLRT
jgi:hypothetical protein